MIQIDTMKTQIKKEIKSLNMPWEQDYGYAQAVKVGNTIYISGQVSHDDEGNVLGEGDLEAQMRATYTNVKKLLTQYGATVDNLVEETIFVTDMDAGFAARAKMKEEFYLGVPHIANTIVQVERLAFPQLMVEIKFKAVV